MNKAGRGPRAMAHGRAARARGITLIELLVVLAVFGILAALTSQWGTFIQEYHRTTILNNLHRALSLARQSATYREQIVTLCPLSGGYGSCSGDWSQPISVFYDPDNRRALTDPSLLIYELPAPASGTLTASSAAKRYFQFRPDGLNRGTLGSITWCPPDNDARRAGRLILNLAGRVRHARDTDGDGIPEDSDGRPLRCPAS